MDRVEEIVFVDVFPFRGDNEDELLDSRLETFFDDKLNDGTVADWKHSLGDSFSYR